MSHALRRAMRWRALVVASMALVGCRESRDIAPDEAPTFAQVQPLLERACERCHGDEKAEGGYRVTSYLAAIGCTADGRVATEPADERAPILAVLARDDHRDLLDEGERARLERWVRAAAPAFRGTVHDASIIDPRSEGWHGKLVARDRFALLREADSELACGRCHEGTPVRPEGVRFGAPEATPCTSCHEGERGVLGCTTCHGQGDEPYAARDACFFEAMGGDAHAAHLAQTNVRTTTLTCTSCHPVPGDDLFAGKHANGTLDVRIDEPVAGPDARYDAQSMSCSVGCHAQGGELAMPTWEARPDLGCAACHQSPPPDHYPGACSTCHREMGERADSLTPGPFHLNGRVDLGDGSGTCGACHGDGQEPWPLDATHQAHARTEVTDAVTCEGCHVVPKELEARGHMDGDVTVRLAGAAQGPSLEPSFDADTKTCSEVACHGAGMRSGVDAKPRWGEPFDGVDACSSCHAAPPPRPHVQLAGCGGGLCHGGEVGPSGEGLRISPRGRGLHIDGETQAGQ